VADRCVVVSPRAGHLGATGLEYFAGISSETAGAAGLCLQLVTIPPATRSTAHYHDGHESAAYVLRGEVVVWFGNDLERHVIVREGEFAYIPAGVPHLPANYGKEPAEAVLARTDPNAQESVIAVPELDELPHLASPPAPG
jgi:uncharacterized RmlC-like cupin family protein